MNMKKWIAAALACSALALARLRRSGKDAAAPAANPDKVCLAWLPTPSLPFESFRLERQCRSVSDVDLMNAMAKRGH